MRVSEKLWFRRLCLTAGGLLLAALGVVTAVRASQTSGPGSSAPNLDHIDLAAFNRPEIEDQLNAASWLEAGAGAVVWSDEDKETVKEAISAPYGEWSPDLKNRVSATLERQRGALTTLHQAAGLEGCSWGIDYTKGIHAEIPVYLSLVWAQRFLWAQARQAFGVGEPDAGLTAVATMARMAACMEEESDEVMALLGVAMEAWTLDAMKDALASPDPWAGSAPVLDRLQGLTPSSDLDAMLRRAIVNWAGKLEQALESNDHDWVSPVSNQPVAALAQAKAEDVIRAARAAMDLVDRPCGTDPERFAHFPEVLPEPERGLVIGKDGGINLAAMVARAQSASASRQALRAAIALRRIGAAEGSYPRDRSNVPDLFLPDPFTGRDITYNVNTDGSARLELDGAVDLLEPYVGSRKIATDLLRPIMLPPPGARAHSR